MPRKAPNQVIEHRISLSNFERNAITNALEKHFKNDTVKAWTNVSTGAGIVVVGAGVCYGAYALGKWLGVGDFIEDFFKTPDRLKGAVKFLLSDRAILIYIQQFPAGRRLFEQIRAEAKRAQDEYVAERSRLEALYYKFGDPASQYYDRAQADSIQIQIQNLDEQQALLKETIDARLNHLVQTFRDAAPLI